MDLIKSRSLIFLSPSPLDTAALFSFCLNTIHSLQQIKLKKPGNKVWKRVNKILCLVKKKCCLSHFSIGKSTTITAMYKLKSVIWAYSFRELKLMMTEQRHGGATKILSSGLQIIGTQ